MVADGNLCCEIPRVVYNPVELGVGLRFSREATKLQLIADVDLVRPGAWEARLYDWALGWQSCWC